MGIVGVTNPAKLRKLSARVGAPVLRAYARWFDPQTTLLVFTAPDVAWVVPKSGGVERYAEPILLTERGISTRPRPAG